MQLKSGMEVFIAGGRHQGKFGTYLYHDRDAGYYVPHVRLHGGVEIVKPWDKEIWCKELILEEQAEHEKQLRYIKNQLKSWDTSKRLSQKG